jgi:hypothetical protein
MGISEDITNNADKVAKEFADKQKLKAAQKKQAKK